MLAKKEAYLSIFGEAPALSTTTQPLIKKSHTAYTRVAYRLSLSTSALRDSADPSAQAATARRTLIWPRQKPEIYVWLDARREARLQECDPCWTKYFLPPDDGEDTSNDSNGDGDAHSASASANEDHN